MAESPFPKMILIVDDDASIVGVIKAQLEAEGYAVFFSQSKEGALEIVQDTLLTAVILDLKLRHESGFDVLVELKRVKPALPVFMVTGSHDESEAKKAFDLGAWDYITKPIDFDYLKNSLASQSPQ